MQRNKRISFSFAEMHLQTTASDNDNVICHAENMERHGKTGNINI